MEITKWSGLTDEQDKIWDEWSRELVPLSGTSDKVAGEIIRAMERIIYRYYNDGDMAGIG